MSSLQAVRPISVVLEHTCLEVEINIIPPAEIRGKCQSILPIKCRAMLGLFQQECTAIGHSDKEKKKASMSKRDGGVKQAEICERLDEQTQQCRSSGVNTVLPTAPLCKNTTAMSVEVTQLT